MRIFTTKHSSGAVRRFFGVLLVLLFSTQFSVKSYAQLADAYIFSTTTSASLEEDLNSNTFSMSSGTTQLVASGVDNGRSAAQSIGFTFNFMGKNFTQFSSTSNGLVALGGSAGTGTGAISTSRYVIGTAGDTVITPFSADLQVNSTGKVHYKLIGSSPNQVLVIEFQNMEIYWSSSTADGTYQVRLYEGSNTIEFVYGAMSVGATFTTGHTGFSYGSTPGQFFSVNTSTHATSTSSIIANAYSSTGAISGLTSSSNGSRRSYVFKQKQNDAGIASIASPTSPLSAGAQNVAVNVKNFGFKTLTSGTINWTVNGVSQTARNFSGKSITTGTTDTVNLGSYTFSAGTTYVVKAWTSNPNATTDESAVNDTLVFTFYPPLSGTYNIGNNGDFSTLTNAVNALNSAGVSGPVTFLLKDATYTTAEVFPIVINQVAGASATNRITIRPAANNTATISGSSATSIIKLNGADFVTIDGSNTRGGSARNLTINNTSTGTSTAAIWVASLGTDAGAKLDTIKNLNISTGSNTVTSTFGIHLGGTSISTSGTGADNDTLTIQNNLITKAYYAIYARGVTTTGLLDGLVITQNIIGSANTTDYVTFRGIDLAQTSNALISKNTIFNIKITTGTTVAAIDLGANNNNARVSQNYISGVNSPSSSGWGAYGINVSSTTNTGITIDNNMISDILAANYYLSPGITFSAFGIRLTGGTGYKIYNNSVHLSGAPANGTAGTISAAFVVTTTTAANFSGDIRNNTFSNVMGGVTGAKSYAIYLASYSATTTTYNYNNYYAGGTYGILGYLTSDRTSLSAWQTATTQDANSVNNNPSFRSATDLHVKALSSSLDAKGVAISGFTTDFDGQTRNSSTPDIGADEYETLSNDLNIVSIYKPTGNVCGDSNTVLSIIITNEGSSSQSSGFSVGAVVEGPNGKSTLSQTSSKSLASDARDTITFSTKINTYNGGSFKIKAYTALSTDGNHLNDTATTTLNFIAVPANPTTKDVAHCGNGKVTLNGSTTSGNTIQWYTASTGGTSFTTGSSFTTPTLNATATYYISAKNASGCESQRVMVKAIVNPAPTGSSVAAGTVFNGTANTGTQADPDITCPGKLLTYEVTPPTGYLNSDYNTTWTYSFTAKTANGTTANTTSNTSPTASANGIINFTPAFANSDSTIILAVTVKDMNTGCDSVMMRYIHILPAPKIAFTAADVCNGSAVTFMNNTTVSSGTLAYKWYFGDNTTSTDSAATHTYTTTGTYTVSLVATNTNGCKDSVTETVTVNPVPAAAFSAGNSCVRNNISFSNASTISSGTMSYMWTFGDGTTSTDENPTKAFSAAGTYGVKLVVSGAGGCKDSVTKNITINAVPQTGFTKGSVYNGVFNNGTAANPDIVCALYTLNYDIKTPTGLSNSTYGTDWEYTQISFKTANGTAAADTTITFPSATSGGKITFTPAFNTADSAFVLSVTVKNKSTGCDTTITRYISVLSAPDADFSATNACEGQSVVFTDQSVIGGGTGNYKWYFGDGSTSTSASASLSHTYASAGTYTVSLVVTVGSGCNDSNSKTINVYARPAAAFSAAATCLDSALSFTDQSTLSSGSITSRAWSFGDGNTSAATNPTHKYASAGNYTVKLVVTTSNGCKDSVSKSVTVYPLPKPAFTFTSRCADSSISFTNSSSISSGTIASYFWKFGDGTTSTSTNPAKAFSAAGTYAVTLIATSVNGCKDSVKQNVIVYPKPKVSFTANSSCLTDNASFTNTSSIPTGFVIASYLWKFGDGTTSTSASPSKKYSAAGTYTVTLIATSGRGCVDSAKSTITIYPQPTANFTFSNRCLDSSVSFTNSSTIPSGTIASYLWRFGDGTTSTSTNPTKAFSAAGTYSVRLIATSANGCKDSVTKSVTVYPKPVVKFSTSNTCVYNAASFTSTSTVSSGTITAYLWRFGDGTTATGQSATHTYSAAGTYDVTLRVTTNNGCRDSLVSKSIITIYPKPKADFTATKNCLDSATSFTNTSSVSSGAITGYAWTFGDGGTATGSSASYTYKSAGEYDVKLVITSNNGCKDSITKKVTVYPKAVAAISSPAAVCLYDSMAFEDVSTIATGYNIVSSNWSFGDGNTSNQKNPKHKYAAAGKYTVTLTVKTANGCTSSTTSVITINALPQAGFSANTVCETGTTTFTNTTSAPSQGGLNYFWNFGDGTSSTVKTPTHKYSTGGNYDVRLVVVNTAGCADTVTNTIRVNYKPLAAFAATKGCAGQNVTFSNSSSIGGDSIASYIWNFGDGTTSTTKNTSHIYASAGRYNVSLVAISTNGCSDTAETTVTVFAVPTTGFTATEACEGSATQFKNSISAAVYTYKWIFGDGDSSTQENPVHQYAAAGTYNVTFTVTNQNGCATTLTKAVKVNAKPVASFTVVNGCFGDASTFINTSTVTGDSIVNYNWNFGDGTTSNVMSPIHNYTAAGTYTILLTVSTATCNDTISSTITISPKPEAAFTATEVCLGNASQFSNTSSVANGNIVSNLWIFDNKDTSTAQNPAFTFTTAGKHKVLLVVMTNSGCADSVSREITVNPLPTLAISHQTTERNVKFTVSDSSYTSFAWTFGDGAVSTDRNPMHRYPTTGNYSVTLVVKNASGCEATFTDTVNITTNSIFGQAKANAFTVDVYPNPFIEATTLAYSLVKASNVTAALYDVQGREVKMLVNNMKKEAGKYTYTIKAAENHMKSGVYMLRIVVDGVPVTKQLVRVE